MDICIYIYIYMYISLNINEAYQASEEQRINQKEQGVNVHIITLCK
jgi:hypothetical protein